MEIKNKRVLVTGSDGFIGSHLVEALLCEGAKVRALRLYNSLDEGIKETVEWLKQNIGRYKTDIYNV